MIQAIQAVSQVDEMTGLSKLKLPIRFSHPLIRTLKKLREAFEPLKQEFNSIWGDWNTKFKPELQKRMKETTGEDNLAASKEYADQLKERNDRWQEFAKIEVEAEIFEFPKFNEREIAMLDEVGFTPLDLEVFEIMNLRLDEAT